MVTASELAGFIAAHAIWCVSDADGLTPMLAFTTEDGQRTLERLAFENAGAAIDDGRQRLEDDPLGATDGVLAYDGLVTVGGRKLDAILLEMRSYAFPRAKATIAVPYTPRSSGRFGVHKPMLAEWRECEDFELDASFEAFSRGIASHEEGAKVWAAAAESK